MLRPMRIMPESFRTKNRGKQSVSCIQIRLLEEATKANKISKNISKLTMPRAGEDVEKLSIHCYQATAFF